MKLCENTKHMRLRALSFETKNNNFSKCDTENEIDALLEKESNLTPTSENIGDWEKRFGER